MPQQPIATNLRPGGKLLGRVANNLRREEFNQRKRTRIGLLRRFLTSSPGETVSLCSCLFPFVSRCFATGTCGLQQPVRWILRSGAGELDGLALDAVRKILLSNGLHAGFDDSALPNAFDSHFNRTDSRLQQRPPVHQCGRLCRTQAENTFTDTLAGALPARLTDVCDSVSIRVLFEEGIWLRGLGNFLPFDGLNLWEVRSPEGG